MNTRTSQRFLAFYDRHRVAVYHLALSILREPQAAQDVMQTVFLQALESDALDRGIRNERGWISVVTKNAAVDHLRRSRREQPSEAIDAFTDEAAGYSPVEYSDFSESVLRCLSGEERRMFTLHYLEGYKYREIAALTGRPAATAQTLCRRARMKLKAALAAMDEEEPS